MKSRRKPRRASFFHTRLLSIVSIALALFILGGIALVQIAGWQIEKKVKEQISFTLLLPVPNTADENTTICNEIAAKPYVKEVRYISPEQAAKELESELGENPTEVLGYNPLQAMVEVNLQSDYANPDSLKMVENEMKPYNENVGLNYRADLLKQVQENMITWQYILWILAAALLVFSFIQINNTTRLVIYGKRLQIRTMSLVGATSGFIQRPIIGQSMADGFMGALVSILMWAGVFPLCEFYLLPDILTYFDWIQVAIAAAAILLIGAGISAITSWRATRRYIRMDKGKIYLI